MRLELQCKENEIAKGSLTECLDSLTAPEEMTGDNKVNYEIYMESTHSPSPSHGSVSIRTDPHRSMWFRR